MKFIILKISYSSYIDVRIVLMYVFDYLSPRMVQQIIYCRDRILKLGVSDHFDMYQ